MIKMKAVWNMNLSVSKTAKLFDISVRTLHYYDEIGLLKPSRVTDAGYRYYDDEAIMSLEQILFFKKLGFSLKEMKLILYQPDYDKMIALKQHRELLCLEEERLQCLIALVDETLKGESDMRVEPFDTDKIEAAKKEFAKEVKEKWGKTSAFLENEKKKKTYRKENWEQIEKKADDIFRLFSDKRNMDPESEEVQNLVKRWQDHITKYHYTCTKEILSSLGQMYLEDKRFTKNIDRFGEGTAQFMSRAISYYCQ